MNQSDTTAGEGTENLGRPSATPVTGQQTPKGKKPTRAERREAARAASQAAALREYAAAEIPAAFQENRAAQGVAQVTGLQTAEERREQLKGEIDTVRGTGALERGRPTEYTDDEADTICSWVMEGGSLRSYCRQTGRASKTVYGWMRERTDFAARYARACEDRADTLADEGIEIVDDAGRNPTIEGVAAAKLRFEARKWIASKLRPQKWGDKQTVEHVGAVNIRIGIPAKQPAALVERVDSSPIPDALPAPTTTLITSKAAASTTYAR
jgi:hypothetical protein